jgi:hypothetical protein
MPSPQRNVDVQGPPPGGQAEKGSTLHTPLQPSPGMALPSSHDSVA